MPKFALRTYEKVYGINHAAHIISRIPTLSLKFDWDDDIFQPYVVIDPGSEFSFVSWNIAAAHRYQSLSLPQPIPVQDPIGTPAVLLGRPAFLRREGVRCEFGEASVQNYDATGSHLDRTGNLLLRAHFASRPVDRFGDRFILLGASFFSDNNAEISLLGRGSPFIGYLEVS